MFNSHRWIAMFKAGKITEGTQLSFKEAGITDPMDLKNAPALEANTPTQKNVVNEASLKGGDLVLTLHVPLSLFEEAAKAFDNTLDPDLEQSPTMLKQLALAMEDDLDTWFQGNGEEWLIEGISENVYDDFLIEPTD